MAQDRMIRTENTPPKRDQSKGNQDRKSYYRTKGNKGGKVHNKH